MKKSESRFGLSEAEWVEAVNEVREAIVRAAEDRRLTCYSEIASEVEAIQLDPYSSLMNHLLGAVFEMEHRERRPVLTSLVTHKYGDKEPGEGFYEMARSLGYKFSNPHDFWWGQVEAVFKRYGRPRAIRRRKSAEA